mgnify:CR=1 FL=1
MNELKPCPFCGGAAEYVTKYFPKGRMAIVTGRLQVRSYTDRDGNKRTVSEVVVENIYYGDYSKPRTMQESPSSGPSGHLPPPGGRL